MLLIFALPSLPMLLIYLLVFCIVLAAAYWIVTNLLPAPFQKWAIGVMIVIAVILLIYFLMGLAGSGGSVMR